MGSKELVMPDGVGFGDEALKNYDEGTFVPVVTATSGTLTTYVASGVYTRIGRLVSLNIQLEISNSGTAAQQLFLTSPFTAQSHSTGAAREYQGTGIMGQVSIVTGSASMVLVKYDNTTFIPPGGSTYRWSIQVTITI